MTKKNELVTTSAEVPAYLKGLEEDTRGNENVTTDDLIIPRLQIIQAISPEIKKNDALYIEGAEQGQLFNTVTREIYGSSVVIVPVYFEKQWLLWKDRKKGGGFGGQFSSEREANEAILNMEDSADWEVSDTPTHVCYVVHNDKANEIAIPMPKSKAKISRQFNSMIRMVGGPRFARAYSISGVEDKNAAGEDFWNLKITPAGFPSEPVFKASEKLWEDISSGNINFSVDQEDVSEANADTDKF